MPNLDTKDVSRVRSIERDGYVFSSSIDLSSKNPIVTWIFDSPCKTSIAIKLPLSIADHVNTFYLKEIIEVIKLFPQRKCN